MAFESSAISKELPLMRARCFESDLWRQNLERKQARAASGEKPPAVQWVHKTSKHQAVTEPRGTIINEMRVLRQGPELLRRETQEKRDVQRQVEERRQQAAYEAPKWRLFEGRLDFAERPAPHAAPAASSLPAPHACAFATSKGLAPSLPPINRMEHA
eukprot:EG_transcript_29052